MPSDDIEQMFLELLGECELGLPVTAGHSPLSLDTCMLGLCGGDTTEVRVK